MKRLLICLVTLLSLTSATYHVGPGGTDGAVGTSYGFRWLTIGKANRETRPGDIVYVYTNSPNTYAHIPNPDSGGSNPTGGGRITFIGADLSADPLTEYYLREKVRVPGGNFCSRYTTVKGLHFIGNLYMDSLNVNQNAEYDSLLTCIIDGNFRAFGADYSTAYFNHILGQKVQIGNGSGNVSTDVFKFGYNTCPNLGKNAITGGQDVFTIGGQQGGSPYPVADSCTLERNRMFFTLEPATIAGSWTSYAANNATFLHNLWNFTSNGKDWGSYALWRVRSGTFNPTFRGDTVLGHGPGSFHIRWSQGADAQLNGVDRIRNLTLDSVVVKVPKGNPCDLYYGIRWFNIRYSQFITGEGIAVFTNAESLVGANVLDHNTFVTTVAPASQVCYFYDLDWWHTSSTMTFTNNILATIGNQINGSPCRDPGGHISGRAHGIVWPRAASFRGKLTSNHNLYSSWVYNGLAGDKSIAWQVDGVGPKCSAPGDNSIWEADYAPGVNDSASLYGYPAFDFAGPDTIPGTAFNANIGFASQAAGSGSGGTDIGALALDVQPVFVFDLFIPLDFRNMAVNQVLTKPFRIRNDGTADLLISITVSNTDLVLTSDGTTPLTYPQTIPGNDTGTFYATYTNHQFPNAIVMNFITNDPDKPAVMIDVDHDMLDGGGLEELYDAP